MSELILHHYWQSPFAEKARLLLGFKGLAWRSVIIPRMLPKPELVALTGGYRKTPVLQVGADVYCDTALIARRLEAEKAVPALFPEGQEAVVAAFAGWADSVLFQHAVALMFQPEIMGPRLASLPPEQAQAFLDDRKALFSGGSSRARRNWRPWSTNDPRSPPGSRGCWVSATVPTKSSRPRRRWSSRRRPSLRRYLVIRPFRWKALPGVSGSAWPRPTTGWTRWWASWSMPIAKPWCSCATMSD